LTSLIDVSAENVPNVKSPGETWMALISTEGIAKKIMQE
jgi:hypothetical protein